MFALCRQLKVRRVRGNYVPLLLATSVSICTTASYNIIAYTPSSTILVNNLHVGYTCVKLCSHCIRLSYSWRARAPVIHSFSPITTPHITEALQQHYSTPDVGS